MRWVSSARSDARAEALGGAAVVPLWRRRGWGGRGGGHRVLRVRAAQQVGADRDDDEDPDEQVRQLRASSRAG